MARPVGLWFVCGGTPDCPVGLPITPQRSRTTDSVGDLMIRLVIALWMVLAAAAIKVTGSTAAGLVIAAIIGIAVLVSLHRLARE